MKANKFLNKFLPGETFNNHVINVVTLVDEVEQKVTVVASHEDTYETCEITMTMDEAMSVLGYEKVV